MVQKRLSQKPISREKLNSLVDNAADIIRTATDYKFILVLLFLKRVSDTWKEEYEDKKEELLKYMEETKAEKEAEKEVWHTFNLKRELLWDAITTDIVKLPENLSNALIKIADLNSELKGVIDKFSFLNFTTQEHREKLRQLIELYNQYSFSNKHVSSDIVGDAYEHILYKFAPTQAKEGEVYTPREVIQLLIQIVDPKPKESVYDPACGSGGMLIEAYKHVREKYGKEEKLLLYGQEYSPDIYGLCRLNLIAHGLTDVFVEYGDSLLYPRFTENGKLKRFDVVVANPPWNQNGYQEDVLKRGDFKERYSFGFGTKSSADWVWIQHMLSSATQEGRIGLVIDNGSLFRGGAEKSVRSKIIDKDLVECVILLPEKLFYNTGAPGAIIIFNCHKSIDRKGKILFINASKDFVSNPSVRRLNSLSKDNLKRIVKACEEFSEIEDFCKTVGLEKILENDYALNVSLYVLPSEENAKIDISTEYAELKKLEADRNKLSEEIDKIMLQLLRES
jgi:type I restriction enzyme M protein